MTSYKRYKIWIFLLFIGALTLLLLPSSTVKANAEESVADVNGTSYTDFNAAISDWREGTLKLLCDVACETVTVEGTKTLDLNGHRLSLAEGKTGSVLSVRGALTIYGDGEICGGVSEFGGGIDVSGKLVLRGKIAVENNTGSNIYLSNDNSIDADGFTGRAGITVYSKLKPFAYGTGTFFSDDPLYKVVKTGSDYRLELSPLARVEVKYENEKTRIFPTTKLDDLKEFITLAYFNENGVPYPYPGEVDYVLEGALSVDKSDVTLTATAQRGGSAKAVFEVGVVVPVLQGVELSYAQNGAVYFDSDPEILYGVMNFTVVGSYEDGEKREILRSSELTAEKHGYITDHYEIFCDLAGHADLKAQGVLRVFGGNGEIFEKEFLVNVSKHTIDVSSLKVVDVVYLEKSGALDKYAFTPDLPGGITPVLAIGGEALDADALASAVYTVAIGFEVNDPKNYEPVEKTLTGRLVVYARERSGVSDGVFYVISQEGGISPEWEFTFTDVTDTKKVQLSGDWKLSRAIEATFLYGESEALDGEFKVGILLSGELAEKENLALFRVLEDGTASEVKFTREGNYLVFEASDLLESCFVIASESYVRLYVCLAICFGVFCIAAAGGLICFLVCKKKLFSRK